MFFLYIYFYLVKINSDGVPNFAGTKNCGGEKARAGREGKEVWGKGILAPPTRAHTTDLLPKTFF